MSYSYYWNTSEKVNLKQTSMGISITKDTLDPNGISVARTETINVVYKFSSNAELVFEVDYAYIIKDDKYYYAIPSSKSFFEEEGVIKLMPVKDIKKTVFNIFFYKSGEIKQLTGAYGKNIIFEDKKNMPYDFEIMAEFNGKYLLKTKEKIMLYNIKSGKKEVIDIDAKTAVFRKNSDNAEPDFLYDNKRFYLVHNLEYTEELTEDFHLFKKYDGFLDWVYMPSGEFDEAVFEEKEQNALWVFLKQPLWLKGGKELYIYAIEGRYIGSGQIVIESKGKYYRSGYDAIYKDLEAPIDVSAVKKLSDIKILDKEYFGDIYTDGERVYYIKYSVSGRKKFTEIKNIKPNAKAYKGVASYMYATPPFLDDGEKLYYINAGDTRETVFIASHKTALKFVEAGYAFDSKMLIEGKVIESPCDYNTIEFVRSAVDVISDFEDKGGGRIKVEYRHYFKDKKGEYLYSSKTKKLTKIK